MQINRESLSPTSTKLTVVADQAELDRTKQHVLKELSGKVKVQGFREGKAPSHLVEKQIDPSRLQTEFLDHAINDLYVAAVQEQQLRPVMQPKISVSKFVPFNTLEFTAELDIVGDIKLADYKKIKVTLKKPEVAAADVTKVLNDLRTRGAEKTEVTRAAKDGDELTIDFKGTDAKTHQPIAGADGDDYPLQLGSGNFIPGFEEGLVGVKAGAEKTLTLTFPKDYGVADLQNRKVDFAVTVKAVKELKQPALDDAFAASIGPFKTVADLKADIKKQLQTEAQQQSQRAFENELLEKLAAKSSVAIPDSLLNEEIDRMEEEEKRNLVYRGQTWQEHLDEEGVTAEAHRAKHQPQAELRVKAGLLLSEVAAQEKIEVTPEELEIRIMLLKNQYTDPQMQAELDKPEARREIASRLASEKTIAKLTDYATKA